MVTWEQREQELSKKLHYIEILGELNIPEEWVTQFRGFITRQFQHQDPAHVLRAFIKRYPVCLATYLVMQGVYSYQGVWQVFLREAASRRKLHVTIEPSARFQ